MHVMGFICFSFNQDEKIDVQFFFYQWKKKKNLTEIKGFVLLAFIEVSAGADQQYHEQIEFFAMSYY